MIPDKAKGEKMPVSKAALHGLLQALQEYQECVRLFHDVGAHKDCADCQRFEKGQNAVTAFQYEAFFRESPNSKIPAWRRDILARRLEAIKAIIDRVEARCLAVDGPCPVTSHVITHEEITEIYNLSGGYKAPNPNYKDCP